MDNISDINTLYANIAHGHYQLFNVKILLTKNVDNTNNLISIICQYYVNTIYAFKHTGKLLYGINTNSLRTYMDVGNIGLGEIYRRRTISGYSRHVYKLDTNSVILLLYWQHPYR